MSDGANLMPESGPSDLRNGHITEDEASLYDRQIRLWGLEAQNRMRSSTVLVLSLRSLAHEIIKNLVLAGIGRLIVMDDGKVTEEDLSGGFLFREEDGAVRQNRTEAALPQIASLNPLVSLTAKPTLSPFVRGPFSTIPPEQVEDEMSQFLMNERVDVVVACDMTWQQMEAIDAATRRAGKMFYGAGTYGFLGYAFADLGEFDFVVTPKGGSSSTLSKQTLSFAPLTSLLDRQAWTSGPETLGGSPFRGLKKNATKVAAPSVPVGILALWEFEHRHRTLPTGKGGDAEEMMLIAEELRESLGVHESVESVDRGIIEHLSFHATHPFPPTLAIVGGLVAQDVLRALSRKDKPIVNLLAVDTMSSVGAVSRWGMADMVDA